MKHAQLNLTCPFRYEDVKGLHNSIKPGMRVLDVGCSYGFETTRLAVENPYSDFIGIDLDAQALKIARSGIWHTSLFLDQNNFLDRNLWHPNYLPPQFVYGDRKNVSSELLEEESRRIYRHKKTQEPITPQDYEKPWSIIRRGKYLKNLEFKLMDLDKMNFEEGTFDMIVATSCVFKPISIKRCNGDPNKIRENKEANKQYISHFMKYLKSNGVLLTGDQEIWRKAA